MGRPRIPESESTLSWIRKMRNTHGMQQWREKVGYPTTRTGRVLWRIDKLLQKDSEQYEEENHGE